MSIRILLAVLMVAGCALLSSAKAEDTGTNTMTKEQVLQLLPRGVDMEDQAVVAKYRQLISAGEKAYPALVELLGQTDDRFLISSILSVFIESHGDKTDPIEAIKDLIAKANGSDKNAVDIRISGIRALGRIGRPGDRECVLGLLRDSNEKVRINALRTIAKLGNESDVKRVEEFLQKRKAHLTADEVAKDYSLREAEKVIEQLKQKGKEIPAATKGTMPSAASK